MPAARLHHSQTSHEAFQQALDALDVIGRWEWDAATDSAKSDAFVALLFNVHPDEAETGVPLQRYIDALHFWDRERVVALIRSSAREGSTFLTEYRVISVDGCTRWVLARGRFVNDASGRPKSGSGILVDITQMRMSEGTFAEPGGRFQTEAPLNRAAEHLLAAQAAIAELQDPAIKRQADALLLEIGRRLAQREIQERRRNMN